LYRAPNETLRIFDYLDDVIRYAARNKLEVIIVGELNCDCPSAIKSLIDQLTFLFKAKAYSKTDSLMA
jgi:hypothetical protein